MRRCLFLLPLMALLIAGTPALAVEPGEILKDPVLEARARVISAELRCLVCQNQSIDDSNAPLAQDLRRLVRERLVAGDTNDQVIDFVAVRYGDFVLLRPPFTLKNALLWGAPGIILLLGIWGVAVYFRRRRNDSVDPDILSADEESRLKALLDRDGER